MAKICALCGKENRDTAKHCGGCSNPFQVVITHEQAAAYGETYLDVGVILENRYKIITQIKTGGMSAIYKAQLIKLNSLCALKELIPFSGTTQDRADAIEWFKREARLLSKLDHANLPKVFDYFFINNRFYLVMNFIEGEDLLSIMHNEGSPGLSEERVIGWAKQLLDVLNYLHNNNPPIVYRDLKPSNIMLHKDGRIMLIDFGIARIVRQESLDSPKTAIGTGGYAPLEQYQGKPEPRSDIYALGATMHHLLSGREPSPLSLEPIKDLVPTISPSLEQIINKAIEDKAEKRFSSAKTMLEALNTLCRQEKIIVSKETNEIDAKKNKKDNSFISYEKWNKIFRETIFNPGLRDIYFLDNDNGWLVGDCGLILSTKDGGRKWKYQKSGTYRRIYSVHFIDLNNGWAAGERGMIFHTTNGGESWKIYKIGIAKSLYKLHFIDENIGWVAGDKGLILRTENKGNEVQKLIPLKTEGTGWGIQKSGTSIRLYGISFFDTNRGCAAGEGGLIKSTEDGGKTWTEYYASKCIMSVHLLTDTKGWAAGEEGTILYTEDGGKSWIKQHGGTSDFLTAIHFADLNNGWAVGGNPERGETILRTGDGGKNWIKQESGMSIPLMSVHFTDIKNGWAAGYSGTVINTKDGGKNWLVQLRSIPEIEI